MDRCRCNSIVFKLLKNIAPVVCYLTEKQMLILTDKCNIYVEIISFFGIDLFFVFFFFLFFFFQPTSYIELLRCKDGNILKHVEIRMTSNEPHKMIGKISSVIFARIVIH